MGKLLQDDAALVGESEKPVPRPCEKISPSEFGKLVGRMLISGVGFLLPLEAAPRVPGSSSVLKAGLFGVPKSGGKLRLVVDRRGPNQFELRIGDAMRRFYDRELEDPESEVSREMQRLMKLAGLPLGAMFTDLFLAEYEQLGISTDDLRDFYYELLWPAGRLKYNAMGPTICVDDIVFPQGVTQEDIDKALAQFAPNGVADRLQALRFHLRVPAMGDLNSAEVSQVLHQFVLQEKGGLDPDHWMRYGCPPPTGCVWEGVYIDDHGLVEVIKKGGAPVWSQDILHKADEAYAEAGLVTHPGKRTRFDDEGTIWGANLSSQRRSVGTEVEKLNGIAAVTLLTAFSGIGNATVLHRLIGSWIHPLSFRRPLMCCFERVFGWITDARPLKVAPLPGFVADELILVAVLSPLAFTDLGADIAPEVFLTDASCSHGAVVSAKVADDEAAYLWAQAQRRGVHVRLDGSWDDSQVVVGDEVVQDWCEAIQWKPVVDYKFRQRSHINLQEMMAWRTLVKRLARMPRWRRTRVAVGLDSKVCIGSLAKGRSSSHALNRVHRTSLPWILGAELYFFPWYVNTKVNAADDPTRGRFVRRRTKAKSWARGVIGLRGSSWQRAVQSVARCRTRTGFRGVRVGEAKNPGPPVRVPVDLRRNVKQTTLSRYQKAWRHACHWGSSRGWLDLEEILDEKHELLQFCEAFFQWEYDNGGSYGSCCDFLNDVQKRRPFFKRPYFPVLGVVDDVEADGAG